MRLAFVLIGGLAAFLPGMVQAQSLPASGVYRTGEQLFALCNSTRPPDLAACDAFLTGAHDSYRYLQDIGEVDRAICVPEGTPAATLRQVAVDYWKANPSSRRYSATSNFWNAMSARFPCRS